MIYLTGGISFVGGALIKRLGAEASFEGTVASVRLDCGL